MWQDKACSLEQRSWKQSHRHGCGRGCGRADVGGGHCRALQAGLHRHFNANCLLIPAPHHAPLVAQRGGWQRGNHLAGKIPVRAGFASFRLLLGYLDACGRKPGCLSSDKKIEK